VVCFIRDPERYLIDFENCPIINARPDNLVEVLREWVSVSHGQRRIQGERGRAYVERNYSNEAFAKRLGSTYRELGVIQ
jgi:glycosyltransferase involved in cell wall biosynthesis